MSSEMGSERKPFLSDEDNSSTSDIEPLYTPRNVKSRSFHLSILLHITLIFIYTVISFLVIKYSTNLPPVTSLHPIENLKLRYTPMAYTDFEVSEFAGPPSPGVDKAWHDLLGDISLRVSGEELRRSNQSSVELPEGGGYMAWLGVFHELHCIKMLRQWNYREHYHPGLEEKDRPHWDIHADHCLDVLRSAAMCHADTTLTTFGWAEQPEPMLNTRPIEHKCVDWSALMDSVKSRIVARDEVEALVNPLL